MSSSSTSRLAAWWLGTGSAAQRSRVSQSLAALGIYAAFALVQHAEVLAGLVDGGASRWLTAFYLGGALVFYGVVRAGLNDRLGGDPSLAVPQLVLGVLSTVGAYAITGPGRGALLSLLALILVYGLFTVRPRTARYLALFACLLLGATMVAKALTDPARHPPAVEALHLLFTLVIGATVAALSTRMAALRTRLHAERSDLAHALTQIQRLASRDDLTGLSNRRHMNELMTIEKARQRRTGQPMAVALLDLDGFKRINDTYGQVGGDLVLKTFAQLTRGGLRATDVMGRWGGEEFLLMLPDTPASDAAACVERMRAHLARLSADAIAPGLRVTFSAGVAEVETADELESAIDRADQALARAKGQGRNCTVVA